MMLLALSCFLRLVFWFKIVKASCDNIEFDDKRDVIMKPYSNCQRNISPLYIPVPFHRHRWYSIEHVLRYHHKRHTKAHIAAKYNCTELASALVDEGVNVLTPDSDKAIPLHYAAWNNFVRVAEFLLRTNATEQKLARDYKGRTALHLAASRGASGIVQLLLTNCSAAILQKQLMARDKYNYSPIGIPLHYAARNNFIRVAEFLLRTNATEQKMARDRDGRIALHHAATRGASGIAQLLLTNCSAEILQKQLMARDKYNKTPIHYAALNNSVGVARIMLAGSPDEEKLIMVRDRFNRIPMHYAVRGNSIGVAHLLYSNRSAEMRRQQRMARDSVGRIPMHEICWGRPVDVAKLLLSNLSVAAMEEQIMAQSNGDNTPLHVVAECININMVKFLLTHVSYETALKMISKVNSEGKTAAQYAECGYLRQVIESFPNCTNEYRNIQTLINEVDTRVAKMQTQCRVVRYNFDVANDDINKYRMLEEVRTTVQTALKLNEEARILNEEARNLMEKALGKL